jgi:hypothetical protein
MSNYLHKEEKLPGGRTLYYNHIPGEGWCLDRYEKLVGFIAFQETFLEPWRALRFASGGAAVSFVEDLIASKHLA